MKYNTALPYFPGKDRKYILTEFDKLLAGDGLLTMGRFVKEFEEKFESYLSVKHAIATTSCTAGLETVMRAAGIGKGDEVIVPAQTFIATASSVIQIGASPVFAEVDESFLLDFSDIKRRVSERTKAVILVHFAGLISQEVQQIHHWLKQRGILLIEDAAHAHGAVFQNRKAGTLGDAACFSFYSTKIITMGEGGVITTNDDKLAKQCAAIRSRGLDIEAGFEIFTHLGTNQRVTEVQALMGLTQLRRLDEFVAHRNQIAQTYDHCLRDSVSSGKISLPHYSKRIQHAYWRYIIFLKNDQNREELAEKAAESGVKIDWAYQPLVHLQPIMKKLFDISEGHLPVSEKLALTHICLPIHSGISVKDAEIIAKVIKNLL